VAHVVIPQNLGNVGHSHRRSGMSGIRFLYGVHAQCADGVCKFSARGHDVLLKIVDKYGTQNYPSEAPGLSLSTAKGNDWRRWKASDKNHSARKHSVPFFGVDTLKPVSYKKKSNFFTDKINNH
jgi:hypothetical protein